jgi:hypothetical protein
MGKGFKYTIDSDKMRDYLKLTTEEKLRWLEEIRIFNEMAMDGKSKKIREKIQEG